MIQHWLFSVSCRAAEELYSGCRVMNRPVQLWRFPASIDFQTAAACNAAFRESLKVGLNLVVWIRFARVLTSSAEVDC